MKHGLDGANSHGWGKREQGTCIASLWESRDQSAFVYARRHHEPAICIGGGVPLMSASLPLNRNIR